MENTVVSVGVVVYNGEQFIDKTLNSLINQSYKNIEIIVSDNASTDSTVEIVKKFMLKDDRVKLVANKENLGFSGNLNKTVSEATSEYVCLYHADDIYEETIVEEQFKYLESSDCVAAFTLGKMIDGNDNLIPNNFILNKNNLKDNKVFNHDMFLKSLLKNGGSQFICPSLMIKKAAFQKVGGFDTNVRMIEDQDMWLRLLENGNIAVIAKELIRYRIHSSQGSSLYTDTKRDEISIPIRHLSDYLEKNKLVENHKKDLNILLAKDYTKLAYNKFKLKVYNDSLSFIKEARSKHNFNIFNKYFYISNGVYFLSLLKSRNSNKGNLNKSSSL